MGMFGGSSMSTSTITSSIDFSPVIQFGESQSARQDKVNEQTQSVSPKLDESMTASASVGVGVGGDGTGGTASTNRVQEEDQQPLKTTSASLGKNFLEDINPTYLVAGAGAVALFMYTKKNKKKK